MKRLRVTVIALALVATIGSPQVGCTSSAAPAPPVEFGAAFWSHWGDNRAEIATYDLTTPRYGTPRDGLAVAVFVTETFANSIRVKSDPGQRPKSDEFPVLKLNLIRDFPTGIYDYNVMTSAFVALEGLQGRPAGSPTKISFSSQEWCGHVYAQLLFDDGVVRHTSHSYFDGEADRDAPLTVDNQALSEDALLLWARGLAFPALAPGESRDVQLVRSLLFARMRHQPVLVERARVMREAQPRRLTVPAGTFEAEVFRVEIAGERSWTFHVEKAPPRRVLQWETQDGESARLVSSDRLIYWEMNAPGFVEALKKIGLRPRPPRTP